MRVGSCSWSTCNTSWYKVTALQDKRQAAQTAKHVQHDVAPDTHERLLGWYGDQGRLVDGFTN
eukprot:4435930-Prymnesium_polylepis.2